MVSPELTSPSPPTVLIADDEELVRRVTGNMLLNLGFRVLEAADGGEALDRIQTDDGVGIDILITDLVMPVMDGRTLAAAIQRRYSDIKILFITGHTDLIDELRSDETDVLTKPFTADQLKECLAALIASPAAADPRP
jgi:CheY-like chemotaxis protein